MKKKQPAKKSSKPKAKTVKRKAPRKKVHKVAKNMGLSSAALIHLLEEIGIKAK